MNIGNAIKLCRKAKNLTQGDLARLTKLSISYISLLEKGKRDLNFSILQTLSDALEIQIPLLIFVAAEKDEIPELGDELLYKLKKLSIELINATDDLHIKYKLKPVTNLASLEKILGHTINSLRNIAINSTAYYKQNPPNKDGRITYRVLEPLKNIQKRINASILNKVNYPTYIHSFIKKRSCLTNAKQHLKANTLINHDIKKFFDNCTFKQVFSIWSNFFNFSPEISDILTLLTTFNKKLPQGASTSPHLSNLMFWKDEPRLVKILRDMKLTYTRYADDVSISSNIKLTSHDKTSVITLFIGMLSKNSFKLKREKHLIYNSDKCMIVNGQNVNGDKVRLSKSYLEKLRAEVYHIEMGVKNNSLSQRDLESKCNSAIGKLNYFKKFHENRKVDSLTKKLFSLLKTKVFK